MNDAVEKNSYPRSQKYNFNLITNKISCRFNNPTSNISKIQHKLHNSRKYIHIFFSYIVHSHLRFKIFSK